jgi:hypothetical protein
MWDGTISRPGRDNVKEEETKPCDVERHEQVGPQQRRRRRNYNMYDITYVWTALVCWIGIQW